jgi:hypothetical protein
MLQVFVFLSLFKFWLSFTVFGLLSSKRHIGYFLICCAITTIIIIITIIVGTSILFYLLKCSRRRVSCLACNLCQRSHRLFSVYRNPRRGLVIAAICFNVSN